MRSWALTISIVVLLAGLTGCVHLEPWVKPYERAALADPWIFRQAAGGASATLAEAADFALRYADAVEAEKGPRGAIAKLKQLVRWYRAGGIFAAAEDERTRLLRCADLSEIRAWFSARQGSA